MNWYPWVVALHVIAAFAFALAHGVAAFVAVRLRRERRPDHVIGLLALTSTSQPMMYGSLTLLLVAGILAGFMGGWWDRLWIWLALGLLLAISILMYVLGTTYYLAVRHAVGVRGPYDGRDDPAPVPLDAPELDRLLTSSRPVLLGAIGGGGLAILVWLMVVKPG